MEKKILLSLSGGIDSTTVLSFFLNLYYQVTVVSFNYGSKHNALENKAVKDIVEYYNQRKQFHAISLIEMDIRGVMKEFQSNLLISGGDIPEGHYEDENMKKTVVPSRNLIFISIIAGLAESLGIHEISLGVHQGDHHIYPDCRPEFIMAVQTAVYLASGGYISKVYTPLLDMDKTAVVKLGISLNSPYKLTRTCYTDNFLACGKCGSCVERLEAFKNNGLQDPIIYQV